MVATAGVGLFFGWRLFWFLCDDAYIAFRYAHNLVHGRGLTWNPAPFAPVEGYSSLAWVLLVSGAWALTGLEPPQTANTIALAASLASLGVITAMGLRIRLSPHTERWRLPVLGLVLFGTVSNRTYLVWSSSGLEQALFTLIVLGWIYVALLRAPSRGSLLWLGVLAGVMELTRPDGLLYVAATAVLVGVFVADRWLRGPRDYRDLALVLPFGIPIAHESWRIWTYGAPLPNTYYAKAAGAWPLSGLLYVVTFLMEHAFFVWLFLGIYALVRWLRDRDRRRDTLTTWTLPRALRAIAIATLVFHWAYYTFNIGGDHFGWRIYMHWIPLLLLAFPWLAERTRLGGMRTPIAMSLAVALGLVIPWTHWYTTSDLAYAKARGWDYHDIHGHFPFVLQWWPLAWDAPQWYLRGHFVGLRQRAHVNYMKQQRKRFPTRDEVLSIDMGPDQPVMVLYGVGYPSWTMPDVAIIDGRGLNDAVVARNPPSPRKRRQMAHDRRPPPGYTGCFRPNAKAKDGVLTITPRPRPLTPQTIIDCETRFLERVKGLAANP